MKLISLTAEELLELPPPPRRWGGWIYDRARNELVLPYPETGKELYGVDLGRCRTAGEALFWLCQVRGKTWVTDEMLAGLVRAFDGLLRPQATLCRGLPAPDPRQSARGDRGAGEV